MRRTFRLAVSIALAAPLALAACKNNQGSIAQTNSTMNAQLEVINQQTPESAQTLAPGPSPDGGKQPASP